jgi:hypothetical protein
VLTPVNNIPVRQFSVETHETNMSRGKYQCVALFLLIAAVASAQAPKRAHHLDDVITNVNLTAGTETIGGASIVDAVNLLRDSATFPVSLEMLEIERPKSFVTLQEALATLHSLQAITPLGDGDKHRLDRYEELAKTHPPSEILVPRQRTFKLVRDQISVREFLVQVTTLDDEYEWKNYGTDKSPQIVIHPRAASALLWPLTPICTPRPISIDRSCRDAISRNVAHLRKP